MRSHNCSSPYTSGSFPSRSSFNEGSAGQDKKKTRKTIAVRGSRSTRSRQYFALKKEPSPNRSGRNLQKCKKKKFWLVFKSRLSSRHTPPQLPTFISTIRNLRSDHNVKTEQIALSLAKLLRRLFIPTSQPAFISAAQKCLSSQHSSRRQRERGRTTSEMAFSNTLNPGPFFSSIFCLHRSFLFFPRSTYLFVRALLKAAKWKKSYTLLASATVYLVFEWN